jgi:hypothetical protein
MCDRIEDYETNNGKLLSKYLLKRKKREFSKKKKYVNA